jgi:hypothetical protein
MGGPRKIKTDNIISDQADIKLGLVEIIGTGSGYMKKGEEYTVSSILANNLIKKGSAILKQ